MTRCLWIAALAAVALGNTAVATVLYDGPLGTAPESQGWLAFGESGGAAVRTTAGGMTTFDTT